MSSQETLFHLTVCISYLRSVWVNSYNSVFSPSWCGKAHTESEHIETSFITFLPCQLAGDGVTTSRESRKGENKPSRAFAKPGTWSGGDKAWVSWPCSEQTYRRGSYLWLESPLLTSPLCSLPPRHCLLQIAAKTKTLELSQNSAVHCFLQPLLL